jgi:four helix bundle protein
MRDNQEIFTKEFISLLKIAIKDFIAKYVIAKKEAKETIYWLNLIKDLHLVQEDEVMQYINECKEILLIISKIINNTLYK